MVEAYFLVHEVIFNQANVIVSRDNVFNNTPKTAKCLYAVARQLKLEIYSLPADLNN